MRLAFFGNGSLGDPGAQVRDGTVADRLELFNALGEIGVEAVYIAPQERSPGEERVVGNDWRGPVDALILETRDAVWPPAVACTAKGGGGGGPCDLEHWGYWHCVEESLGRGNGIPAYTQAKVLRDWAAGEFSEDGKPCGPPVLLWDFDLNVRRVIGTWGRGSTYELGAFWRKAVPWMSWAGTDPEGEAGVLRLVREDPRTRILAPYSPELAEAAWKRAGSGCGDRVKIERFDWCYPRWLETSEASLRSFSERHWDLVYAGSDYDRRRRWTHFYVDGGLQRGARVAVTGTWGDRRGGREKPPWNEKGFRSRLEAEWGVGVREEGGLWFLSPASTIQLPFMEAMREVSNGRVSVQVVPDEYSRLGYYTNRWAETWARGTICFMDEEIRDMERFIAPELRDRLVTGDPQRVEKTWKALRWGGGQEWAEWAVETQRAWLREEYGGRRQAERLVDIVERAGESG